MLDAPIFEDRLREWVEENVFKRHELDLANSTKVAEAAGLALGESVPPNAVVRIVREIGYDKNFNLELYPFTSPV